MVRAVWRDDFPGPVWALGRDRRRIAAARRYPHAGRRSAFSGGRCPGRVSAHTTDTSSLDQAPTITDGILCPPQAVTCHTIGPDTEQWTHRDGSGGFPLVDFRRPKPADPGEAVRYLSEIGRPVCGLWATGSLNRPVFCVRSGWVWGLADGPGFERSSCARTRWVGCRRVRCAGGGC